MSCWTDQWKDFVTRTSYLQTLAEEKISNDQFWRSYGIYDQALMYSGYPGEILAKISSFISPGSTLLDIGAGTGAFAIFRANGIDSLNEFAYGPRPYADYTCLFYILDDLGYRFDVMLFPRNYSLHMDLVFQQYRFCKKSPRELLGHLSRECRLEEKEDGTMASFQATDALLYLIS